MVWKTSPYFTLLTEIRNGRRDKKKHANFSMFRGKKQGWSGIFSPLNNFMSQYGEWSLFLCLSNATSWLCRALDTALQPACEAACKQPYFKMPSLYLLFNLNLEGKKCIWKIYSHQAYEKLALSKHWLPYFSKRPACVGGVAEASEEGMVDVHLVWDACFFVCVRKEKEGGQRWKSERSGGRRWRRVVGWGGAG